MEENFAKLENELRQQLERAQHELIETIIKTQQDMVAQISQLVGLKAVNEYVGQGMEDTPLLQVSATRGSKQGIIIHTNPTVLRQVDTLPRALWKVIVPQMENTEEEVPDLNEMENLNKVKAKFSKQLEEARKDLE